MNKLGIIIIFIIGILFRLVMLDKPEGLWNDEYVSYMISAKPLWASFIKGIKSQCHMPMYYFYLKATMAIFGQSDLILRASSVVAGILSMIVMYFVGLEKNKLTGLFCLGFSAISSFLIYYSQEVRLYSLLFLFSALTLLFTLRLVKVPNLKNLIWCIVANFLILFTHTIGFVFVFFNLVYISYKLYQSHKTTIIKMWAVILILTLLLIPQIISILFQKSFSQWWGTFSPSVYGFLITDYFSPVITNFTGAPPNFFYNFKSGFIIFALIPSLIGLIFVINSLKEKANRELLYIVLATIAVLSVASLTGKLVFITKYSIEIYPMLIYLACLGAASMNNKIIRNTGVAMFCILNIFFLLVSPLAANKLPRKEGHNLAAQLIKEANLEKGDIIILQYYAQDRFNKYYNFENNKVISMNKGNFFKYIQANTDYAQVYKNGKEIFRDEFSASENSHFAKELRQQVSLQDKQSVLMVVLKSVSFFDDDTIKKIAQNDVYYAQTPLFFLVFSHLKNKAFQELAKDYAITGMNEKGEWIAVKFTKLNK